MIEDYIHIAKNVASSFTKCYWWLVDPDEFLSCAYLALAKNYENFNGDGDITAWLYSRIRYELLDFMRKEDPIGRQIRQTDLDSIDPMLLSVNGYEIKRFEDHQFIDRLMSCAKLPDRNRRRIYNYFLEDMTMKEIGKMEGVGEAAVSISIKRTLAKMRGISNCSSLS